MRTSWATAVSLALVGCGAEFAAVEEQIVDGGDEAGESEGGVFASTSSTSATRVTIGGTIVSTPPRKQRVVAPTAEPSSAPSNAARLSALQIADLLDAPTSGEKGGIEVAAAWTEQTEVRQLVTHGDHVTWSAGYRLTVADRRDGTIVRTGELPDCDLPFARVQRALYAVCRADNSVAAIDPETLAKRWERPLGRMVASLDAGGDLVLVALRNDKPSKWQEVVALSDDGEVRWRSWLPAASVAVRGDGDRFYAYEWDPTVWSLDRTDGHVRWSRNTEKALYDVIPIHDSLAAVIGQEGLWLLDDGRDAAVRGRDEESRSISEIHWPRLYAEDNGKLRAIDLESGREVFFANMNVLRGGWKVFASDDRLFVDVDDHLMALDTTQPAGLAPAIRIVGRYKDVINEHKHVRGLTVVVGNRHVRTDAHGRFVATVHMHGPVPVRMEDVSGDENHATIWPDGKRRYDVELSNNYYEDCH